MIVVGNTRSLPPILDGLRVVSAGESTLPIRTCVRHLELLGAHRTRDPARRSGADGDPSVLGEVALRESGWRGPRVTDAQGAIRWESWPDVHGSEAVIQAASGLMGVHGRDGKKPRRLGLDVASVAAGIVAAQGVLAGAIAKLRGCETFCIETSVLRVGLLLVGHHVAIATCDSGTTPRATASGPGPPFRSADGHWVELEVLSPESWITFWQQLGVGRADVGEAWLPFVHRYVAGCCRLPVTLHEATRRHGLADIQRAADSSGTALARLRSYPELLADVGDEFLSAPSWSIQPTETWAAVGDRPSSGNAPLEGLRVVEMTSRLQGPLAGLLLQMLGAQVVKVEPPGGDFGRSSPPLAGSVGAAYLAYNRGKEVVEVDCKRPAGRAEIFDLVGEADVFLHNWRPGRAESLGLDADGLVPANPRLVYAHASGWGTGRDGPSAIAGDYLVQAHAACGDGLNPVGEPAFPSRVTLVDVTGGLLACEAILAALYLRERTGQASRVETSLFGAAMALQSEVLERAHEGRELGRRAGRPQWGPLDRPIETADGYLVLDLAGEHARRRFADAAGLDAAGQRNPSGPTIVEWLQRRSASEWERHLLRRGVPVAAVRTDLARLPNDPRLMGALEPFDASCWMPAAPWELVR